MNKFDIFNYLKGNVSGYTLGQMITNLAVIFFITLLIFAVYKTTVKRVNYYSNFGIVIMLTAVVTGVIMMIIESNLALSLGMVGALSIIRFRSAIKDPVDTSYIFWAVAVGISAGTGNFMLAIVSSLMIAIFVLAYSYLTASKLKEIMIVRGTGVDTEKIARVLDGHKVKYAIKSKSVTSARQEYIYEITCHNSDSLAAAVAATGGVDGVNIVSGVNV